MKKLLIQLGHWRVKHYKFHEIKNAAFRDVSRVTLARTEVSEELIASIDRVKRIGELGTMLAVCTSSKRASVAS
jgi:hypothetical protein